MTRHLRRPWRVVTAIAALALAAPTMTACDSGEAASTAGCDKTYTIGFSHPYGQITFVKALKKKVEAAAQQHGCVKLLLDNTQNASLEDQRATIEGWVTQHLDAIVLFPVEATAVDNLRQQAQAQGTKWLTYGTTSDTADGSVGWDNNLSGQLIAKRVVEWVKKTYPNGGVSAAVTTDHAAGFEGRYKYPIAALKQAGIDVVSTQDCSDQTCGLQVAEDTLREHPNLRIFLGDNDDPALGAMRAFTAARVPPAEVFIAGQDGNPEALDAVKAGGMYRASAAIKLDDLAKSIIDTSINAITGQGKTDNVSGVELASLDDPARLDQLIAQYE